MGILRVMRFEFAKNIRQRPVQIFALVCVAAAVVGGVLAPHGIRLIPPRINKVGLDGGVNAFTVLGEALLLGVSALVIFLLIHVSMSLADERTRGTVKCCLTSGVRRSGFFLGKLFSEILLVLVLLAVVLAASLAVSAMVADFAPVVDSAQIDDGRQVIYSVGQMGSYVAQLLVATAAMLAAFTAAAFLLSAFVNTSLISMAVMLMVLFAGLALSTFWQPFAQFWPPQYVLSAHDWLYAASLDLADTLPFKWAYAGFAAALGAACFVVFGLAAVFIGMRKDVIAE